MNNTLKDQVKDRADCREVFNRLWPDHYREHGNSVCPFHDDHDPSLSISAPVARCFGACNRSYDAIDLYMKGAGCGFSEAIEGLAEMVGIAANKEKTSRSKEQAQQGGNKRDFQAEFSRTLSTPPPPEVVEEFTRRKLDRLLPELQEMQLIGFKAGNSKYPPCAVFPVMGIGTSKGYERLFHGLQYIIPKSLASDAKKAKRFAKGTNPNVFMIEDIRGPVVITEGVYDALSVREAFRNAEEILRRRINVCSIFSASNTKSLEILVTDDDPPILFLDRDKAGQEGTLKAIELLGGRCKVVDWSLAPEGCKDPNDLLVAGREDLIRQMIQEAKKPEWQPKTVQKDKDDSPEEEEQTQNNKREAQAKILLRIADAAFVFHDDNGVAYATFPVNDHTETWPVRNQGFKRWLRHQFYLSEEKPPGAQAVEDSIGILEAQSHFGGEKILVHIRVAEANGKLYLDLCNDAWEAVEIGPDGWRVVSDPPVKFLRKKGMLELPRPEMGGSWDELRRLLNIKCAEDWMLVVSWLIGSLHPHGPYPILCLEGVQGSGKSTIARLLRSLIDPSSTPIRTSPRKEEDLIIAATSGWVIALDNLSGLPIWLSDGLCRISTGGGFGCRQFYTNDEQVLFTATRPIILNGIDQIASRHDLIDRSIITELPAIPEEERREESRLWREFAEVHPRILGLLCNAVGIGLRNRAEVKLDRLPRLADFARWVVACESALPWSGGEFMETYTQNRNAAIETTLHSDPVADAIIRLMEAREHWEGSATELLEALSSLVPDATARSKPWPKDARSMGKRLRRGETFLKAYGIDVNSDRKSGGNRLRTITLDRREKKTSHTSHTSRSPANPHQIRDEAGTLNGALRDMSGTLMSRDDKVEPREIPDSRDARDKRDVWDKKIPSLSTETELPEDQWVEV